MLLKQLIKKWNIPVVSSRRVRGILKNEEERYYFGCAGLVADRYANYILQNSGYMLSLGSGLRYYLTAYNESNFAPKAKRTIINVDAAELDKLNMPGAQKIQCNAGVFIKTMLKNNDIIPKKRELWWDYCNMMKQKYPSSYEYEPKDANNVNPYKIVRCISQYMGNKDTLVTSPSAFIYVFYIPQIHAEQRFISHIGLGSMGTALPGAIGACVASKARVIVCEGDGSLQHNIQELALLKNYDLPIIVFVDSNKGYRQIQTMQDAHFNGRHAGCTEASGITFPDLDLLAKAYGLRYIRIDDAENMEAGVKAALADDKPKIVEVITTMDVEYLPIVKSKMDENGIMQTPSLEVMFPFLPEEEHRENMKISEDG